MVLVLSLKTWVSAVFVASLSVAAMAQYRSDRPVRGAWLRPPATVSALETNLQSLARAGITDLYLETFYHGLSTGHAGVFNSRFGYDYLGQAIPMAARYNIRLHAWVEAAYWQYGTTGAYNFASNPEWQVISLATGTTGGDIAGQVFANLCHPGVQQKLNQYCSELAQYPGLWGIQTDYHRFPVDDNTGDNYTAPWSYESWTNGQFMAQYGASADIFTTATRSGQAYWNQFLTWRRNGISEAARQMYLGIQSGSNDVLFSAAVFPTATTSSAQISKCQNWPAWCTGGYVDHVVPMAYGFTTSSITSDLNTAKGLASGKKVVAGLAITSGHPTPTSQLAAAKSAAIEDFIFFEASVLAGSNEAAVKAWLASNATPIRADLNNNGVLDAGDYQQFLATYSGTTISTTATNRLNMDGDSDIDTNDHRLMREAIAKEKIGGFGRLSQGDRDQLNAARTAAPAGGGANVKNIYDFDLDGDVDDQDSRWMEKIGSSGPFVFVQVQLGSTSVPAEGRTVQFQWLDSNDQVLGSWTETLGPNGSASFPAIPSSNHRLTLQVGHWLRKSVTVPVVAADFPGIHLNLMNGDVDGDNEIGPSDFAILSSKFGATEGDANFDPAADLDEDGEIGPSDFAIVAMGFGSVGD